MGERVELRVDGPVAWVRAQWGLRNAGLAVDDSAMAEADGGYTFGVTLPDEAAKGSEASRPVAHAVDELDYEPLGSAKEERGYAKRWKARAVEYRQNEQRWMERAEKAEAQLASALIRANGAEERADANEEALAGSAMENLRLHGELTKLHGRAEGLEATIQRTSSYAAALAAELQNAMSRATKAEAELSRLKAQPSAGDRVRGLSYDVADRARGAPSMLHAIAAELDKQDASQAAPSKAGNVVREKAEDGPLMRDSHAGPARAHVHMFNAGGLWIDAPAAESTSACSGPVTLVNGERERYGNVTALGTLDVVVAWQSEPQHIFSRADGSCVESTNGVMRGWRVHPDELPRFQPAAPPAGDRVVVAEDGTKLFVEYVALGSGSFEVREWRVSWQSSELPFVKRHKECPADAEVLADYAAWKAGQK